MQHRIRKIEAGNCTPELKEKRACNKNCPFCTWSAWAEWDSCDSDHFQESQRKRFTYFKPNKSVECSLNESQGTEETERKSCVCLYTNWTQWGDCGKQESCKSKIVTRKRVLREDSLKDASCRPAIRETKVCWPDTCVAKTKPCETRTEEEEPLRIPIPTTPCPEETTTEKEEPLRIPIQKTFQPIPTTPCPEETTTEKEEPLRIPILATPCPAETTTEEEEDIQIPIPTTPCPEETTTEEEKTFQLSATAPCPEDTTMEEEKTIPISASYTPSPE
eukprot:CAMPEP_0197704426 /NCGR_PEP_ID=MMETSP1338-20131121/125935_1 /TAXON_ID=43686 ORGANISM="Pelagodinium beii, Strain RCC1491" /NCGR_SAMPLE_ID=MMETSP1338 /ASSEMBLY_ACC=CAM_ASM_000754 /LENGTH=275 /DNA_ID=CAMNT_0043288329 /DNA_START=348 /DNA_END=1175 /DNA_ORIENTATION=+